LEFYESLDLATEIVVLDNFKDILKHVDSSTIIIPHGSFVAYVPLDEILSTSVPIYGTKSLLKWEADRRLKDSLMEDAGLLLPKHYESIDDAEFPVIVKYDGADGGKGYFIAYSKNDYLERIKNDKPSFIQEFIVGTKVFTTLFHSIIRNRLEIFGTDIRYETDADAQFNNPSNPAFNVVGNLPMVLRESLLIDYYEMGKKFVKTVHETLKDPMIGPFCLETVIDRNMKIHTFEFSGRIVAGTNIFVPSSPYAYSQFGVHMSMGRRIALEIKEAIQQDRLKEIIL